MTYVGMMFEKEKEEAVKAAVKEKEIEKNKEIKALNKEIKEKDNALKKEQTTIEKLKKEIVRLGGNAAMF